VPTCTIQEKIRIYKPRVRGRLTQKMGGGEGWTAWCMIKTGVRCTRIPDINMNNWNFWKAIVQRLKT